MQDPRTKYLNLSHTYTLHILSHTCWTTLINHSQLHTPSHGRWATLINHLHCQSTQSVLLPGQLYSPRSCQELKPWEANRTSLNNENSDVQRGS